MGFSGLDYGVLIAYLAGITAFRHAVPPIAANVKDYFIGARRTHWLVISLSIVATETSTLTLIGVPAIAYSAYAHPEQGGTLDLSPGRARVHRRPRPDQRAVHPGLLHGQPAHGLPVARSTVRVEGEALHGIAVPAHARRSSEGVRLFATSLVVSAVIGASLPGLPHLWLWSIVLVGALTLIYTYEGGIAAVIWTDLIQFVIYVAGSLLAGYQLLQLIPGGWRTVAALGSEAGKFQARVVLVGSVAALHLLGRPARRHLPDDGVARDRPAARPAPVHLQEPA